MPNNRRDFLKKAALAGTGMALYPALGKGRAWAFAQSPTNLRKFVTSVPGLGPSAKNEIGQYIPLATKHSIKFAGKTTDLYNVAVGKFRPTDPSRFARKDQLLRVCRLVYVRAEISRGSHRREAWHTRFVDCHESHAGAAHSPRRSDDYGRPQRTHGRRSSYQSHRDTPARWSDAMVQ